MKAIIRDGTRYGARWIVLHGKPQGGEVVILDRLSTLKAANAAAAAHNKAEQAVTCAECGRSFDLTDEQDAAEWTAGHDCEAL